MSDYAFINNHTLKRSNSQNVLYSFKLPNNRIKYILKKYNSENSLINLSEVEENPNCVLLLDEVEKAAPEVLQVLLQVMDDGNLTGSTGKKVDFTNVVLLMTSNLGAASSETLKIGFGDQAKTKEIEKAVE